MTLNQNIIERIFSSEQSKGRDSWDDAIYFVQRHAGEFGGEDAARELMDAFERAQRDGLPFTKDPSQVSEVLQKVKTQV